MTLVVVVLEVVVVATAMATVVVVRADALAAVAETAVVMVARKLTVAVVVVTSEIVRVAETKTHFVGIPWCFGTGGFLPFKGYDHASGGCSLAGLIHRFDARDSNVWVDPVNVVANICCTL